MIARLPGVSSAPPMPCSARAAIRNCASGAMAHSSDAIAKSVRDVLTYARANTLLHAVVSATHGADTELLPLLTTHSESLLSAAKVVVRDRVLDYDLPMSDERLDAAIDAVVRVVLSHVMQPSGSPEETAEDIAWIASRVLR